MAVVLEMISWICAVGVLCFLVHLRGKAIGRKELLGAHEESLSVFMDQNSKREAVLKKEIELLTRELSTSKKKK